MKTINDYKGTKTAIHCKTQEEFNRISKMAGYDLPPYIWGTHKEDTCINTVGIGYGRIKFYSQHNYTILPASDFIPTTRTIEQIETELEVLRNELDKLKAQTPKKKPIEFVKYVYESVFEIKDTDRKASKFDNVELLFRYGEVDIMKAWNNISKNEIFIFLGHFNDGIK